MLVDPPQDQDFTLSARVRAARGDDHGVLMIGGCLVEYSTHNRSGDETSECAAGIVTTGVVVALVPRLHPVPVFGTFTAPVTFRVVPFVAVVVAVSPVAGLCRDARDHGQNRNQGCKELVHFFLQ